MNKYLFTTIIAGIFTLAGNTALQAGTAENMDISKKNKAIALLNSIETGDQKAVNYVNPAKYIQHNLVVGDGLAGFDAVLQALPKGSAKVNVIRAFEDGDFVFTHTDYNFFGPKIGFDVFRFENGLIVEHWDNLVKKSATVNPSGRTQIDGPVTVKDLEKTAENKALVVNFINSVLVKGETEKLSSFFDGNNYIQHNTNMADGFSSVEKVWEAMAKKSIKVKYIKNHKVLGEGNFVLSISEGSVADKPISFYDLFRIENGKIAEHWDVVEGITPEQEWKNSNGKFGGL